MGIGNTKAGVPISKSSFLKKRTKKLLHGCRRILRDSRAKVFASFFQKEAFPS
jgi:hypothetical protein